MPAESATIFEAEKLCKTYPDGSVSALVDVNMNVNVGQFVAITGKSGSGKSTLLNLLGALDQPTSGTIKFQGRDLASWPSLDKFRAEKVGFVFQSFHLLPTLTAIENVQIPMFGGPRSTVERARVATRLLDLVGMSHRHKHLPSRLSVGERQRVSIARALANDPEVLLADEPTGNLDSKTGAEILDLFEQIRRDRNMTLLVVTHTKEVSDRAERIVHIHDGRIESDESVSV
jgi:putative ABC transport system ATP-binding protein